MRPVLIVGWVPRIVIPVARSLARNNLVVDVGILAGKRIGSRAIRHTRALPDPVHQRDKFASELFSMLKAGNHDLLIPADDNAMSAILAHYADFESIVQVACPPPAVAELVLDKSRTLEVARQCGVRVPQTEIIEDASELRDWIGRVPFPWILKPAKKQQGEDEFKTCNISGEEDLTKKFAPGHRFWQPVLLQEVVQGAGVGVEMLMHRGECLATFQHRRLKEWPCKGGYGVTAIAETPDPQLASWSLKLLRSMQWEGVAMVEYKVHPITGEAVLMEVNGRYWGSISLPIAAGMDFPLYHWRVLHGEEPEVPESFAVGTRWRWTAGYVLRCLELIQSAYSSQIARRELALTVSRLEEDFGGLVKDALFTWSDPWPAAAEASITLRCAAATLAQDLARLLTRSGGSA